MHDPWRTIRGYNSWVWPVRPVPGFHLTSDERSKRSRYAAVALLALVAPAFGQVVSRDREAHFRAITPAIDDEQLQAVLADDRLVFYTEREMPRAYQFAGHVHSPYYNTAFNPDPTGNANHEFPWKHPAGTDNTHGVTSFRFLHLPRRGGDDGRLWPVVYWWSQLPNDDAPTVQWIFPRGAIIGEVLCVTGHDKKPHAFEVRTRTRGIDSWGREVYRPYPSPESLAAKIETLRPASADRDAIIRAVLRPLDARGTLRTLSDTQPRRRVFRETAAADVLPAMPADLVDALLDGAIFQPVTGQPWKVADEVECHAPTSAVDYGIVPRGYQAHFVPVNPESCTRCHETTLRHAEEFAANVGRPGPDVREWYGRVRGSDGIFSFHPFDPTCVAGNGASLPVRFRDSLLAAGAIAAHDPQLHPREVYRVVQRFNPARPQ